MHKRADTIGCVWLAYCINSCFVKIFTLYFRKLSALLIGFSAFGSGQVAKPHQPLVLRGNWWENRDLHSKRLTFPPSPIFSRRASLSFTLHGTSRLFRAVKTKERRCHNEKTFILPYIVYHFSLSLSSSCSTTIALSSKR